MSESKAPVLGCFAFLYAVGAMFLALAWYGIPFGHHHGRKEVFARDQVLTTGTVVRFDSLHVTSERTSTPVIEIPLGNGRFRFYGEGQDQHPFDKGDAVPVGYPAGHPERAYIRTFRQMYFGSLLMIIFASPFLALAIWGTIMNIRALRRRQNE